MIAAATALVLVGCGGDSASTAVDAICAGPILVAVGQGTTPSISWSPACKAQAISVEDVNSGTIVWSIANRDGMTTPITYGSKPVGSTTGVEAAALQRGTAYDITVFEGLPPIGVIGEQTFTP
jgi:hypothetical protein